MDVPWESLRLYELCLADQFPPLVGHVLGVRVSGSSQSVEGKSLVPAVARLSCAKHIAFLESHIILQYFTQPTQP